jgi:tetratricopeptide (TPR) repeat protein
MRFRGGWNFIKPASFIVESNKMTTSFRQRQVLFLVSIALITITLIAYEPIRHNDFVSYDDGAYITGNPNVTCGITRESVIWAFTNSHMGNWHPLTFLSHMLDCEIFGLNPAWHHFINILFHILSALLIFWILTATTGTMWPSAFVAAIFAIHPIQVESVAWASERKTVLSGFFWFLTMAVYIWYTKRPSIRRYTSLFLVYGLSIMTKPLVVTLPLVLLLLDYWPLGRLNWGRHAAEKSVPLSRLLMEKAPLLAMSAILSLITIAAQQKAGALNPIEAISLNNRVANTFISYAKYVSKTIWPNRLAAFYPYNYAILSKTLSAVCILLFVAISAISIHIGRRRKYAAVGWLWYVGTLIPMIGLVQVGDQAMADRYMYIPMVGLLVIVSWAVRDLILNRHHWKPAVSVIVVVVLLSAVIATRTQVRYWQNSMSLFEHALKVTENNPVAEKGYGSVLFTAGRLDEAAVHLRKAMRTHPAYFSAGNELGRVYLRQGKFNEAVMCFNELLKHNKESAEIYYNLGVASILQKKYEEAIKHFAKVLELDPKYPDIHSNMGIALLAAGKNTDAIKYLNEALNTSKNQVMVYANLGTAYTHLGMYKQAIQNWNKVVELDPNNVDVLNNLAWLLATFGEVSIQNANRAIELAEQACEITGYKNPEFLDTLAVAYAAVGRFDDAVKKAQQAVDIAKASGQEDLCGEIQRRLELYKAGKRYHQK